MYCVLRHGKDTHFPVDAEQVMLELCRVDEHLARLIRKVGTFPTEKQKPQPPFESLLRAIVYPAACGRSGRKQFSGG